MINKITLIGIMAQDKDGLVGLGNDLPWKDDPETKWDMKFFKNTTSNHAVIMGYKTYESMGKPLKNRINVVIDSHSTEFSDKYISVDDEMNVPTVEKLSDDVFYVVKCLENAVQFLEKNLENAAIYTHSENTFNRETVYLIGGAKTVIRAILDDDLAGMYITTFNKSWLSEIGDPVYLDLSDVDFIVCDRVEEHPNGYIENLAFNLAI